MREATPTPALSIVLPAFNEEGNIERAVLSALEATGPLVRSVEVVAVDDGSRDRTAEILERLAASLDGALRVVRHGVNRGYGAALRSGFAASTGDLVFYTDSDNQFDLRELADVLPRMSEWDAVLGFRMDRREGVHRRLVSGFFNTLATLAFGIRVRDLNCSFKVFQGDRLRRLALVSTDFFIDTEIIARIHQDGWRYTQVGVHHYPRSAGQSSVRPSDVPRTLVSLARIWWRLRRPAAEGTLAAVQSRLP